ncbi:glycosyl transferase family protein [Phenylobacterium sp.]|jgi:adsorption protein B|uniref:glycosyl transferase family protein n=1 Tax=Phenylobacterium sp. TaxID=1871053 RepID=UPI002F937EC2
MPPALNAALNAGLEAYSGSLQVVAVVVAVLIAASSADDLFIDAFFWARELHRKLVVSKRHTPLTEAQLHARPQQHLAIMVPAWKEDDVIAAMVENAISTLDYQNYTIFCGTYPNDAATISEVERARRRYSRRVVRVEVDHAGPTCKADCLNAIVKTIFEHEKRLGIEYAGVILHDCEDVLHPLELKFYNYLLPRKDMIQLPVASLERKCSELIAGTYMDEFAEWHSKDLVVREILCRAVPSAGVGTCFSRRALLALQEEDAEEPFNTASLTEDYDIGARLRARGMTSIIARFPVSVRVKRKTLFGLGPEKTLDVAMPLCVREYFPNTFRTSYRQKARWTLGIAYQGWAQLGWADTLKANYFFVRDRKAIVTPLLSLASYLILLNFVAFAVWPQAAAHGFRPIFPDQWWFWPLIAFNGFALAARTAQRLYFVNRFYGWEHALLSLPRMVVATFVNLWAAGRATRIFFESLMFGKGIVWDKTMHDFPTAEDLGQERRRLGEILVDWRAIEPAQLEEALAAQARDGRPLGRILQARGWLDDETLAEAVSVQADVPRATVTTQALKAGLDLLPRELAISHRIAPLEAGESGLTVAAARPLTPEAQSALETAAGQPVQVRIARESEITAGLVMLAWSLPAGRASGLGLGELLADEGLVPHELLRASPTASIGAVLRQGGAFAATPLSDLRSAA